MGKISCHAVGIKLRDPGTNLVSGGWVEGMCFVHWELVGWAVCCSLSSVEGSAGSHQNVGSGSPLYGYHKVWDHSHRGQSL